jgi:hypothetical protein
MKASCPLIGGRFYSEKDDGDEKGSLSYEMPWLSPIVGWARSWVERLGEAV